MAIRKTKIKNSRKNNSNKYSTKKRKLLKSKKYTQKGGITLGQAVAAFGRSLFADGDGDKPGNYVPEGMTDKELIGLMKMNNGPSEIYLSKYCLVLPVAVHHSVPLPISHEAPYRSLRPFGNS